MSFRRSSLSFRTFSTTLQVCDFSRWKGYSQSVYSLCLRVDVRNSHGLIFLSRWGLFRGGKGGVPPWCRIEILEETGLGKLRWRRWRRNGWVLPLENTCRWECWVRWLWWLWTYNKDIGSYYQERLSAGSLPFDRVSINCFGKRLNSEQEQVKKQSSWLSLMWNDWLAIINI